MDDWGAISFLLSTAIPFGWEAVKEKEPGWRRWVPATLALFLAGAAFFWIPLKSIAPGLAAWISSLAGDGSNWFTLFIFFAAVVIFSGRRFRRIEYANSKPDAADSGVPTRISDIEKAINAIDRRADGIESFLKEHPVLCLDADLIENRIGEIRNEINALSTNMTPLVRLDRLRRLEASVVEKIDQLDQRIKSAEETYANADTMRNRSPSLNEQFYVINDARRALGTLQQSIEPVEKMACTEFNYPHKFVQQQSFNENPHREIPGEIKLQALDLQLDYRKFYEGSLTARKHMQAILGKIRGEMRGIEKKLSDI